MSSADQRVQRYAAIVGACGSGVHRIDYEQRADGPFVRFDDYAKLDAKAKRYRQALDELCCKGRCPIAEAALGLTYDT